MDLNKDLTLSELTKEITEVFFPNGVSEAQNIRIAEVDFYIAAFSGEKLVHADGDGNISQNFRWGIWYRHSNRTYSKVEMPGKKQKLRYLMF